VMRTIIKWNCLRMCFLLPKSGAFFGHRIINSLTTHVYIYTLTSLMSSPSDTEIYSTKVQVVCLFLFEQQGTSSMFVLTVVYM
jgi:hypothetical protein